MAATRSKKTTSKTGSKAKPAEKAAGPDKKKATARKAAGGGAARKKAAPKDAQPKRPLKPTERIAPYQPKKGEEYMSDAQREHFRQLLLAWKRELMEEVDRTVHHMQDEASNFPDPNDRASQESEFSIELRTRDRERKLLRKIESTLKAVETSDYGYCESCGAEIGIRRLEARPTATLCIDCKTLDEIRERQKGK